MRTKGFLDPTQPKIKTEGFLDLYHVPKSDQDRGAIGKSLNGFVKPAPNFLCAMPK